jgi:hypothetical protein
MQQTDRQTRQENAATDRQRDIRADKRQTSRHSPSWKAKRVGKNSTRAPRRTHRAKNTPFVRGEQSILNNFYVLVVFVRHWDTFPLLSSLSLSLSLSPSLPKRLISNREHIVSFNNIL